MNKFSPPAGESCETVRRMASGWQIDKNSGRLAIKMDCEQIHLTKINNSHQSTTATIKQRQWGTWAELIRFLEWNTINAESGRSSKCHCFWH